MEVCMDSIEMIEEILKGLADAVIAFNEEKTVELARFALERGIDPSEAILKGLAVGMNEVGKLYEKQ
jgi:dimethylamine corrinoid protein